MTDETRTTKKAGLSSLEVGAGAGAAVITAFATSYLGTAGTLTGAALASVVGTVSTSVLRSSAETSGRRLRETTARLRETRVGHAGATDIRPVESEDVDPYRTQFLHAANWIDPERRAAAGSPSADPDQTRRFGTAWTNDPDAYGNRAAAGGSRPAGAYGGGRPGAEGSGPWRRVRARWVVMGAGAVAAFALSLGAITGIEAIAGKPLSGLAGQESGGGTTLGRATGADRDSGDGSTPSPTPAPTTGGASPTEPAPSNGPSPSGSATAPSGPPASSGSPVPSPTQPAPTQAPGASPSP
jgi:hypothetical protein